MSVAEGERSRIPASAAARFCWGLALTPIAGLIGFFLALCIFNYQHPAAPSPYPIERPPWWDEATALVGLGLLTSLFSWPVTLVVFPLARGYFPSRIWKAFGALVFSGLATGLAGPIPALLLFSFLRPQNAFQLEWFFPTLGAVSGFLTAIPYFFLTNPRRVAA